MTRAASSRVPARATATSRPYPSSYLQRSQLPLASLIFLLPFMILYEVGTRHYAFDPIHHTEQRIIAFNLMLQFFHLFGATGRFMPPLAVVFLLLAVHIARNDPWKVQASTLLAMFIEAAAWALPLLALGTLSAHWLSRYLPLMNSPADARALFVLSIGAGVYEELVFRLAALTLLHTLFIDIARLPKFWGYLGMVVTSSLAFAFYHYLGSEPFAWRSLAFRTGAGVYFAGLFLLRGFGVTAAAHSFYDLLVIYLRLASHI
jgi:hypothetical protein